MMLPEDRQPGWYWVQTKMFHRKPFKKWVIVELIYEPDHLELDIDPYCWIDANSDEFEGQIISVGPRIPDLEEGTETAQATISSPVPPLCADGKKSTWGDNP